MTYGGHFDIDQKIIEKQNLEIERSKDNFWNNVDKANEINYQINNLDKMIIEIEQMKDQLDEYHEMLELLSSNDQSIQEEISEELLKIENNFEKYSIKSLLNNKYDSYNCILEIHPGAGGTESCDWANMLLKMYQKYCQNKGFKFSILDEQKGEEAGIKNVVVLISGEYAYGYLKSEKGVHRLVRISPFDSNSRRHTSFASVSVIPEINKDTNIEINQNDLKIDVFHSGGAGGQSVNTTDSAVRITHLPTNIVVSCQRERSQLQNKELAMNILRSKLNELYEIEENKKMQQIKGENKKIEFGSQIRSYTLEPYKLIKDNRFNYETSNVENFLNGDLEEMIDAYLKSDANF